MNEALSMKPQQEIPHRSNGMTSDQLVTQHGRMPLNEAIQVIRYICADLAHVHSIPLTHCGVEPGNIMVTPEGRARLQGPVPTSKMQDDKRTQADGQESHRLHVAPEEALGHPVDTRADIYGLGAAFYFLLTGRPLFDRTESTQMKLQHITDTAPAVTQIVPSIPPVYARIVAKMLAKPPEDRYQTVASVLADLDAAAFGWPTLADEFRGVSSCDLPSDSDSSSAATVEEDWAPPPQLERTGSSISRAAVTMNLSNFEWCDQFCLGVPELDAQHKWWFRITRNFFRTVREGQVKEETVCILLEQLMRYAGNHFASEEKFMATISYPSVELKRHQAAHRKFEDELESITEDLLAGKKNLGQELATFLANWLTHHILEVDVKYLRFYRDRQKARRETDSRRFWAI